MTSGAVKGPWTRAANQLGITYAEYASRAENNEQHCFACKTWKPAENFRVRRGSGLVLSSHCIDCHREYMREYMRRRYREKNVR